MTKREVWLKLFSENDTALATAIHLCNRFVTKENLVSSQEFIQAKVKELDDPVPRDQVELIFPSNRITRRPISRSETVIGCKGSSPTNEEV